MTDKNHSMSDMSAELPLEAIQRRGGAGSYIVPFSLSLPEEPFWEDSAFLALARACSSREPHTMMALGEYFEGRGDAPFFSYAANFWKLRAFLYGNADAREWMKEALSAQPRRRIPPLYRQNSKDVRRVHTSGHWDSCFSSRNGNMGWKDWMKTAW